MKSAETKLRSHELRVTKPRIQVVELLIRNDVALSQADLADQLPEDFDRVTIYRTLKSFEDKGLIHAIPDPAGDVRYALCNEDSPHDHHESGHDHIHFKCIKCDKVECLPNKTTPVNLPKGYSLTEVEVLVTGICANCA